MLENVVGLLSKNPSKNAFLYFVILLIAVAFARVLFSVIRRKKIEATINALASSVKSLTPEEFFRLRNSKFSGRGRTIVGKVYDFPGVYIVFNKSKRMHYVGQSLKVLDRVNCHFTGKGNGDVYADYKYGDDFDIKMIGIEGSGYLYLNDLERDTIASYKAFSRGYNRTRGNM